MQCGEKRCFEVQTYNTKQNRLQEVSVDREEMHTCVKREEQSERCGAVLGKAQHQKPDGAKVEKETDDFRINIKP